MPNPCPCLDRKENQREELNGSIKQVMELRAQLQAPYSQQADPSIPEQVRQLAEPRDQGILSQEEFEAKKGRLLSGM